MSASAAIQSRFPVLWLGCRTPVEEVAGERPEEVAQGHPRACPYCEVEFIRPKGSRQEYCSPRCRVRHNAQVRRARKASAVNGQAAAVLERAARDGFPSNLEWSGDA